MVTRCRRAVLAAAAGLALALSGCDRFMAPSGRSFNAIDITGAEYARRFQLPDQNGQVRTLADFKGKVTFVFFGYTHCPDVCPSTLAEIAQVKKELGADAGSLQVVFITVDPQRDTPALLKAYVESFDPSFVALRGSPEETAATAKEFKVFFAREPGKTEGYSVDHTAGSYVFDRTGRVRLFVRYGSGAAALAADLKALLAAG